MSRAVLCVPFAGYMTRVKLHEKRMQLHEKRMHEKRLRFTRRTASFQLDLQACSWPVSRVQQNSLE